MEAGSIVLPPVHDHVALADWAKPFTRHRAELRDSVLIISGASGSDCFKLAYAVMNPPVVVFWPLLDVSDDDNAMTSSRSWGLKMELL